MNIKRTLLIKLGLIVLFSTFSSAQTSIMLDDFNYMFERQTQIYTYIDSSTATIDIGSTTSENIWDFSTGLSIDKNYTYDVISPAGTPYRPDYPNAHVAFRYALDDSGTVDNWEYYCRSVNLVHLHGLVDASLIEPGQVTKYIYTPIKLFAFVPMTLSTVWRDSVEERVVTETNGTVRGEKVYQVITDAMVDAYGTIVMPDSSTTEALRARIMETRTTTGSGPEVRLFYRFFAKTGETLVVETDPSSADSGMVTAKSVKWTLKSQITTDVPVQTASLPDKYSLAQNYPNPFNPTTNIRYSVPEDAQVILKVYNTIGKEVATLVNDRRSAGTYIANLDGRNLSSGIYFVKMTAGRFNQVIKMTLVK